MTGPAALLVGLALLALSSEGRAADWTIGAGVGAAPDYEGSEDYEAVPVWNLSVRDLYHPSTYVRVTGPKLASNFLAHPNFRLGLSAQYVFSRSDVENNSVDNLDATDDGVLLGVLLGYDYELGDGRVLGVAIDPRWDIEDDIGGLVTLGLTYRAPLLDGSWQFRGGINSTYASEDYMDEFFGIGPADASRSGLDRFDADAGFKDLSLDLSMTYKFTDSWSTTGLLRLTRLLDDAEDSPVTDDEGNANQAFVGLLINYGF